MGPWDYTASTESQHVKAIALQYEPSENVEDNKSKILGLLNNISDADLIVLPELSLTGVLDNYTAGNIIGVYHKVHLNEKEKCWATAGNLFVLLFNIKQRDFYL